MKNFILSGSGFRPCFMEIKDFKEAYGSTEVSTDKDFLDNYRKHIEAMGIIAECAKIFILENWDKVNDWTDLNVMVGKIEYYNYKPREEPKPEQPRADGKRRVKTVKSPRMEQMLEGWDKRNQERRNPVTSFTDVVLDPSDGDFFITINNTQHYMRDDEIIIIADYIETQLKTKNK